MKGEAENTIVRIVIALIIIGVIVALIYLSLGPFRREINYQICYSALKSYCADKDPSASTASVTTSSSCQREMPAEKSYVKSISSCEQLEVTTQTP
ncbi:MAG: hypothetical protein QXM68_03535 [Candidatus Aenigmatarchaeota archaeon]|nr:hypothetical protein [Candidatus Aenigmarchaeota archaeon]